MKRSLALLGLALLAIGGCDRLPSIDNLELAPRTMDGFTVAVPEGRETKHDPTTYAGGRITLEHWTGVAVIVSWTAPRPTCYPASRIARCGRAATVSRLC